MTVKTKLEY